MAVLKRSSSKKPAEVVITEELPKNSMVINSSVKSTIFVYDTLKSMILPASKGLDYLLVGVSSVLVYNFVVSFF
tara:strand:- start:2853 stop:3074 length:222 start_codon:yes stop_codon:yes gene_type:complete